MSTGVSLSLKRPLVALTKVGYHEIVSVVTLSVVFWLASLPLITVGAALIALFDVVGSVYHDGAPRGERERLAEFGRSLRRNLVRGLPLTVPILFVLANTALYLFIVVSDRGLQYAVGSLLGLYFCLFVTALSFRTANIMTRARSSWRTAVRRAVRSWTTHAHFTVLQLVLVVLAVLVSIAIPLSFLLLLPAGLALFELAFYEEIDATDPRSVLSRYEGR